MFNLITTSRSQINVSRLLNFFFRSWDQSEFPSFSAMFCSRDDEDVSRRKRQTFHYEINRNYRTTQRLEFRFNLHTTISYPEIKATKNCVIIYFRRLSRNTKAANKKRKWSFRCGIKINSSTKRQRRITRIWRLELRHEHNNTFFIIKH